MATENEEQATAAVEAVNNYLLALTDPDQLVDAKKVAAVKKELNSKLTPLERAAKLTYLARAESPSSEHYVDGFIQHARTAAEQMGVDRGILADEPFNVPDDVLDKAWSTTTAAPVKKKTASSGSRVTQDEIKEYVLGLKGPETKKQIMAATKASIATVTKALNDLKKDKLITEADSKREGGQGAIPKVYAPSGS
jgi:CRP-like cAMP-binding protein